MRKNLVELDLEHIWHPCSQMKDYERLPLIPIKRGKGVYLYDFDDKAYIDNISSWWVNIFGHSNEYINSKIQRQLEKLEHVIFAGFTHEGAIELSQKLVEITSPNLQKIFFADNGSSAVEVALKMSFHYFKNKGIEKSYFLSLTNSYHGETLGALSVGDVSLYKDTYAPLLINNIQTPVPKDTSKEATKEALLQLEEILEKHHKKISAFIIEPLIQGAGSMHMYSPEYLKGARELCSYFGVHLILDEIMTGFGRTGSMFAYEQASIEADFLCLSKGLTGGYLPLAVVLTTNEVYSAFYCDYHEHKAFLHSHSYTANPLSCAAALATLELFEKNKQIKKNKETSKYIASKLEAFKNLSNIQNIRQTGMVAAFDIKAPIEQRVGLKVYEYGLEHGVILRPLGNTIYFMPPYVITKKELDKVFKVAYEAVEQLL
jgi:adenosylmethionine-8-amino-7-oxononanoate aminotransferase